MENREVRLVRVLVEVGPEFYFELCLQLCGLEALGRVGVLLLKLLDGGQVGVAAKLNTRNALSAPYGKDDAEDFFVVSIQIPGCGGDNVFDSHFLT